MTPDHSEVRPLPVVTRMSPTPFSTRGLRKGGGRSQRAPSAAESPGHLVDRDWGPSHEWLAVGCGSSQPPRQPGGRPQPPQAVGPRRVGPEPRRLWERVSYGRGMAPVGSVWGRGLQESSSGRRLPAARPLGTGVSPPACRAGKVAGNLDGTQSPPSQVTGVPRGGTSVEL